MLFANFPDKGDIEIILALVMGVGNYLVQRRFFDFRAKDELIKSLKEENEAKDVLIKGYKQLIERLRIHKKIASIRHEELQKYRAAEKVDMK